jgi:hypothetical protein
MVKQVHRRDLTPWAMHKQPQDIEINDLADIWVSQREDVVVYEDEWGNRKVLQRNRVQPVSPETVRNYYLVALLVLVALCLSAAVLAGVR